MPGTTITTSSNIALLDSLLTANLCDGKFYVSASPSVFIGNGSHNVIGAKVRITNPYGVVVRNYPASSYDLYFGSPNVPTFSFNIPTQAGNYQYGQYKIDVQLTDADNSTYIVTKTISICEPDSKNKTRNYGSLSAQLNGVCKDGKVYVIADTVPTYKGVISDSQVNTFTLEYPTSSGLDVLSTTIGSFSTVLFEGTYKFNGTICASYNFGDNIFVKVNYKVKREKNIKCIIDECCVFTKLADLNKKINTDCTDEEKQKSASISVDALLLLKTAQLAAECGYDPSDYISQLEDLLGCICTCNCNDGTPIINNNPSKDFTVEGCNITKNVVGLTDHYTIENYAYAISIVENGGALTAAAATLDSCTKTQPLTFSIGVVYTQIKNLANENNTQADFWASIVRKNLRGLSLACLGLNQTETDALTFDGFFKAIIDKVCECCDCDAEILETGASRDGSNVILAIAANANTYSIDIYLDGIFEGNILYPTVSTFTFINVADGETHTYTLIPKCNNGKGGIKKEDTFGFVNCPHINPPIVSSNNVNGVTCPYDLTALVSTPPMGITTEWHTANNTSASSLVGDPTAVSGGVYYAFAKDSQGCYSTSTQVTVICDSEDSCTAPQSLLVTSVVGGSLVQFQSASNPPPFNSYLVKRKLASAPDVSGSYTTLGTPSWNASTNRWELLDVTATNNVYYTYRALSLCANDSTPYIDYNFANLVCPTLTLVPGIETINYSFTDVGGSVDRYSVEIWNADGTTLIHTDTHLPVFSTPITGTFLYLDSNTEYQVRVTLFVSSAFKKRCPFVSGTTESG